MYSIKLKFVTISAINLTGSMFADKYLKIENVNPLNEKKACKSLFQKCNAINQFLILQK